MMENEVDLSMGELKLNRELDIYYDNKIIADIESHDIKSLIDSLLTVNRLPFSQGNIYFTSNTWDFSEFRSTNVIKSKRIFNFNKNICPTPYKNIVKIYTLIKILEDKLKIQSITDLSYKIMNFFRYIESLKIYSVHDITAAMIKRYLNRSEEL